MIDAPNDNDIKAIQLTARRRGRSLNLSAHREERLLEQQVADRAYGHLLVATSAEAIVSVVTDLHTFVHEYQNERTGEQQPDPLACRAGCTYCCALRVDALAIEAVVIALTLRRDMNADLFALRHDRILQSDLLTRGVTDRRRTEMAITCPMLEDGNCCVRDVRPIDCRGFVSPNVELCKAMSSKPGNAVQLIRHPHYRTSQRVRIGLQSACQQLGRDARVLELNAALKIALETSNVVDRWIAGELLFASACPDEWD